MKRLWLSSAAISLGATFLAWAGDSSTPSRDTKVCEGKVIAFAPVRGQSREILQRNLTFLTGEDPVAAESSRDRVARLSRRNLDAVKKRYKPLEFSTLPQTDRERITDVERRLRFAFRLNPTSGVRSEAFFRSHGASGNPFELRGRQDEGSLTQLFRSRQLGLDDNVSFTILPYFEGLPIPHEYSTQTHPGQFLENGFAEAEGWVYADIGDFGSWVRAAQAFDPNDLLTIALRYGHSSVTEIEQALAGQVSASLRAEDLHTLRAALTPYVFTVADLMTASRLQLRMHLMSLARLDPIDFELTIRDIQTGDLLQLEARSLALPGGRYTENFELFVPGAVPVRFLQSDFRSPRP